MDNLPATTGKDANVHSNNGGAPTSSTSMPGYSDHVDSASASSITRPGQHHSHGFLDDTLNLGEVEAGDRALERAEAQSHDGVVDVSGDGVGVGGGGVYSITPDTPGATSRTTLLDSRTLSEQGFGGKVRLHAKVMRPRGMGKVTTIELFFDLVFVYAISAIATTLEHHLTWETVLEMLLATLAVWWSWVFSAWVFNWFNPDSYLIRLLLLGLMLASLIMSAVIPESFTTRSLLFAGMYVVIQVGRSLVGVLLLQGHKLQKNFVRILSWFVVTAVLWLVGGGIGGIPRNTLWTIAIVIEYLSPAAGFYTPGLGKSLSSDWEIHGGHLAERCSLFIIIALGESIVVTGEAFSEAFHTSAGIWMFIVAFFGAASMWWIYFHTASEEATEHVEHSDDPGKMGRLSYTYIHVLMVIGIIWVAVADRLSLVEPYSIPAQEGHELSILILIGGPILFVVGHACFRWTFCCRIPYGHLTAVALLLCSIPIALYCPIWATALTTTIILMMLSWYESFYRCYILPKHKAQDAHP
ncbi:hypothetical protein BGW42_001876 [Actinomortierella wolfii]|nr:hypothetical protein BGW42_001876 [Actinomortierella wolfii]